ncbi:MAG: hypothetical protein ACRDOH_28925 [Streptosporangiaceae bacterium]
METVDYLPSSDPTLTDLAGIDNDTVMSTDNMVVPATSTSVLSSNSLGSIVGSIGADVLDAFGISKGMGGTVQGSTYVPSNVSNTSSYTTLIAFLVIGGIAVYVLFGRK